MRTTLAPIEHPAWCAARERVLRAAAAGPVTLAILGPAGTGKTLLLQELAGSLRGQGRDVTLVRQGDLPFELRAGGVFLVDEAARLDQEGLDRLAAQSLGIVVLADLPRFARRLDSLALPPVVVPLRPLSADEMRRFAAEWLSRSGQSRVVLEEALDRVIARSQGIPRVASGILKAVLAMADAAGQVSIGAADIEEVVQFRLDRMEAEATLAPAPELGMDVAQPVPDRPGTPDLPGRPPGPRLATGRPAVRRRMRRNTSAALAVASLAALAVVAVRQGPAWWPDSPGRLALRLPSEPALLPPSPFLAPSEAAERAAVPDIAPGDLAATELAQAALPEPAEAARPNPAGAASPVAVADHSTAALEAETPALAVAGPPFPARAGRDPEIALEPPRRSGSPGLVLLARAGDTMERLYRSVYRGVEPPPFADVASTNRLPLRPGALVVFPAPVQGWRQR